ncbi:unnamed protein product [Clonostachys rosea]|uniref:Uncharacterized protein n=1 Tax=Bionectria ochroleuca TaxID=29856 RepID=A0ABY6UWD9_BIOOC|nr:unnamed protein product [Clonostachys rosea]
MRQKKQAADAEDGAYFYREESVPPVKPGYNYGNPITGKPEGSMIAAWGVKDYVGDSISTEKGENQPLCDFCQEAAYKMGVLFEGADQARYLPPPAAGNAKKPADSPSNQKHERPGSPSGPAGTPPKKEDPKIPSSQGSPYGGTTLDKLTSSDEKKVKQWTQPKGQKESPKTPPPKKEDPKTPPPKKEGPKTPSSQDSPYKGTALDKLSASDEKKTGTCYS